MAAGDLPKFFSNPLLHLKEVPGWFDKSYSAQAIEQLVQVFIISHPTIFDWSFTLLTGRIYHVS